MPGVYEQIYIYNVFSVGRSQAEKVLLPVTYAIAICCGDNVWSMTATEVVSFLGPLSYRGNINSTGNSQLLT